MHDSVLEWAAKSLTVADIRSRRVLEVGSYDVNGSVRPIVMALEPASYVGVDQGAGPGVDETCNAIGLVARFDKNAFDVVISTEMLEHVTDWRPVIMEMVNVLAPDGLLVLTTRSPGFPYHPYPVDTWRYTVDGMRQILAAAGLVVREVVDDPQAPGVFAIARKPFDWQGINATPFDHVIGVTPMVAP